MAKVFLTDRLVSMTAPPPAKEIELWDEGSQFLMVRISGTGHKSFYFSRRLQGRLHKVRLGEFPGVNVATARNMADQMVQAMREGVTPKQWLARCNRASLTLGQLFQKYIAEHLYPHTSTRGARAVETSYSRYFAGLIDVAVSEISINQATAWMNDIGATSGHATANRQLRNVKSACSWGITQGLLDLKRNPFAAVQNFKDAELPRERYLKPDEIQTLLYELDREANQDHADIIRLCLWTCQRPGNVLAMEVSELDLAARCWTIPAAKAKARKSIVVALTPEALKVIDRRLATLTDSRFMFPSRSKSGHVECIYKTWDAVRERCGFDDSVCLYTLRHTGLTLLGQSGASAQVLMKAAGHASSRMSDRYVKMNINAVLEAQTALQGRIVAPDAAANVVRFSRKQGAPSAPAIVSGKLPDAGPTLTAREQRIVEGKILASIGSGKNSASDFHKKIGACVRCPAHELARILESLTKDKLIYSYIDGPQRVIRYGLTDNLPIEVAPPQVGQPFLTHAIEA